jgi:transcription antitermination factor NusB
MYNNLNKQKFHNHGTDGNKMERRRARELALELIFEYEFNPDIDPGVIYENALDCREFEDDGYIREVFYGIVDHKTEIDAKISASAVGWSLSRMSKTSLSIMRLSVCEMLYMSDIPFSVSINEAVELAKKYDHDKAPAFINGVLNKIADTEGIKQSDG